MFRVKVCGITNVEDAIVAVEAGADAIGLNFYEGSPRYITLDGAAAVSQELRGRSGTKLPSADAPIEFWLERHFHSPSKPGSRSLSIAGVFVNHPLEQIQSVYAAAKLTAIQLHGDEPVELIAQAKFAPLIRARRFDDRGVGAIAADLDACRAAGRRPNAVLIDAMSPGRYGGTGETVSWVGLADHKRWLGEVPLILAGGLTPDNVAEAIRIVRPAAVDVASGVEASPGKKDPVKVRDFVTNALGAFEALEA